jgi:hypothetical protein
MSHMMGVATEEVSPMSLASFVMFLLINVTAASFRSFNYLSLTYC